MNDCRNYWKVISGLVAELKRCDQYGATTASIAMSYICIDALSNLARPIEKTKVTRDDFKQWVERYLECHSDQPYQYRSKDLYAARCALLHTYGAEAELHDKDPDTIKFGYHDGGRHEYNPSVNPRLALIGSKSLVNDVVTAVQSFLAECKKDEILKERVESRLSSVLQMLPYPTK